MSALTVLEASNSSPPDADRKGSGDCRQDPRKRSGGGCRSLSDVGLEYLTLDRLSSTLSGGEAQRINLATSLGAALVGTLYVLDEPSIGLHSRDNLRLIDILRLLRDQGNTVWSSSTTRT